MIGANAGGFFDRRAVLDAVGAASAKALGKAGGLVRKIAQRSMPYRKRSSRPGEPPSAHKPRAVLRKLLFYRFDRASHSVVVGPMRFGSKHIAQTLEFGGDVEITNSRRRQRQTGGFGELAIGGHGRTARPAHNTLLGPRVMVTYGLLRTAAQAARANRINERLYGPAAIRKDIAPRPFMGPALQRALPELPEYLRNAMRG